MKPTDISAPDYFHKVVDCQWACPAHTPVPEYIRLIAEGRYSDAYMINWRSNVFPGILGRTCDRPCEPACRRGRVEETPVAICRLKRVAADFKDDVKHRMPRPSPKNGKRIAIVGGGPASLTVARDLAPLGYHCIVFDSDPRAGGMMRTQIPKFRLPDSVIDEETDYILDLGLEFRGGQRIDSLKKLLAEDYDAIFVGSGAPRGRELEIPGRKEAAANIHIGIDWLACVSFGHTDKIGKRVIVLGGGNTAMDCCRTARRLGGEDVKVIVRSGFEEMKASPWEKEDAMHEDIPILNFLVPKAFIHDNGKLTGVIFEKVKAEYDAKGRRNLVPAGEPDLTIACDDVLVAVGQENAFPWIERDCGIEFDKWDMPKVDRQDHAARPIRRCSSAATPRSGRRTSSGRWRMAMTRRSRSTSCARGEDITRAPAAGGQISSAEDGHPRVELRQRRLQRQALQGAASRQGDCAEGHPRRSRARLRRQAGARRGPALPELRHPDRVHRAPVHRMRRLRRHLPDGLHHLHRQWRGSRSAAAAEGAVAASRTRTSTSPTASRPDA